jgi:hypothetical protein
MASPPVARRLLHGADAAVVLSTGVGPAQGSRRHVRLGERGPLSQGAQGGRETPIILAVRLFKAVRKRPEGFECTP